MTGKAGILREAQEYAQSVLSNQLPPGITYHTLQHTRYVVNAAVEIARDSNLPPPEHEIIELAAWFHDLGYCKRSENHEQVSAYLALAFLGKRNYDSHKAAQIAGCIMATRMPQSPKNQLEAIVCDADMLHLADDDYFRKAALLRREIQYMKEVQFSDEEWLKSSRRLMEHHSFFTQYAQKKYSPKKLRNLKRIIEGIKAT